MIGKRMKRARAFTLMELLVCVGIISMILGVCGTIFAEVIRLRGAQDRYNVRLDGAEFLLRRVSRAVRSAAGFAASAGTHEASEKTLILRTGEGHVVYRCAKEGVERIELAGGHVRRDLLVEDRGFDVRFDVEGEGPSSARSVVVTVSWEEPPEIGISRPVLSQRAAPRNEATARMTRKKREASDEESGET